MNNWREVRLEDVSEHISRGVSPKYVDDGIMVLNQKCIRNFSIDFNIARFTSRDKKYPDYKFLRYGDILINSTGTGTLGRVSVYLNNTPILVDSHITIVRTLSAAEPKFLAYYLHLVEDAIISMGRGATNQQELNKSVLQKMKFKIPDLETQQKIADVLSTYDELIENNNRRIEILEKTVEEIYKEWFVRMRFPGYENTKFIKGIPEGWEVKKIGSIIKKLESGKRPKNNYEEEKMIVSLGAGDINGLGEHSYTNKYLIPYRFFKEMNRGIVEHKDIGIYKDGAYTGKTTMFRDDFPYAEIAINEHVFLVQCKKGELQNYLLFTLRQKSYFDLMQILSMTSAQPGLNQTKFKNIKIEIPTKDLVDKFHEISEIYLKKIYNLAKQNKNLSNQRDLLLPRLMNGTIEVK